MFPLRISRYLMDWVTGCVCVRAFDSRIRWDFLEDGGLCNVRLSSEGNDFPQQMCLESDRCCQLQLLAWFRYCLRCWLRISAAVLMMTALDFGRDFLSFYFVCALNKVLWGLLTDLELCHGQLCTCSELSVGGKTEPSTVFRLNVYRMEVSKEK